MAGAGVIKPHVGLPVLYHPHKLDFIANDGKQPLAGTISYVHSSHVVNLGLLDQYGNAHVACKVPLLQGRFAPTSGGYATWPETSK